MTMAWPVSLCCFRLCDHRFRDLHPGDHAHSNCDGDSHRCEEHLIGVSGRGEYDGLDAHHQQDRDETGADEEDGQTKE